MWRGDSVNESLSPTHITKLFLFKYGFAESPAVNSAPLIL